MAMAHGEEEADGAIGLAVSGVALEEAGEGAG